MAELTASRADRTFDDLDPGFPGPLDHDPAHDADEERPIGPGRDQATVADQEQVRTRPLADQGVGRDAQDFIGVLPCRPLLFDPPVASN